MVESLRAQASHTKGGQFKSWPNQSNNLPNLYVLLLPSLALGITKVGQVEKLGHGAHSLASQWGSTIKSPYVCTVTCPDMTLDLTRL